LDEWIRSVLVGLWCRSRVKGDGVVVVGCGASERSIVVVSPQRAAHDGRNKVRSLPRRRIFYFIPCIHLSIPSIGIYISFPLHSLSDTVGLFLKVPFRWFKYVLPSLYCAYIATLPLAPRLSEQSPPLSSSSSSEEKEQETSTATSNGSGTPVTTPNEASTLSSVRSLRYAHAIL
jgi:hypothetical protein